MKTSSNIQIGKQQVDRFEDGGRDGRMAKGKRALAWREGRSEIPSRSSSVAAALTLSIEAVEPRRSPLLLAMFAVAARGFCRRLRARGAADRLLYPAGAVVGGRARAGGRGERRRPSAARKWWLQ